MCVIKGRFSALAFVGKALGYQEKTDDFHVWKMLERWLYEVAHTWQREYELRQLARRM